jgi:hypothetical protein
MLSTGGLEAGKAKLSLERVTLPLGMSSLPLEGVMGWSDDFADGARDTGCGRWRLGSAKSKSKSAAALRPSGDDFS